MSGFSSVMVHQGRQHGLDPALLARSLYLRPSGIRVTQVLQIRRQYSIAYGPNFS
jgi:hypothetical protein